MVTSRACNMSFDTKRVCWIGPCVYNGQRGDGGGHGHGLRLSTFPTVSESRGTKRRTAISEEVSVNMFVEHYEPKLMCPNVFRI